MRQTGTWTTLLIAYLLLLASTCEEAAEPGPSPSDITKEKRELLGDLLKETIQFSPEEFPVLDRQSKRDSFILIYLQSIYDQVTNEIRQDRQSSPSNRWDIDRKWKVTVLDIPQKYAFTLPGGHFYISTGFLGSLSKGYEIYYLMAFEAVNIQGRYLIDNLIAEYSTAAILDIVDLSENSVSPSLFDLAQSLKRSLLYEDSIVQEMDEKTAELICQTSIFDRLGIIPLLEVVHSQEQWRTTRPSYSNRLEHITNLNVDGCGDIKSTGAYQKMVLDNL